MPCIHIYGEMLARISAVKHYREQIQTSMSKYLISISIPADLIMTEVIDDMTWSKISKELTLIHLRYMILLDISITHSSPIQFQKTM